MNAIRAKVTESGRLSLPAPMRRAMGLDRGGDVVINLEGKTLRIRTLDEVVAEAQAFTQRIFRGKKSASVDAFIAEKRREAAKE